MKFTNRDGEIRFYDGTATPYFLKIVFSGGDLSAPLGPPRPEEELLLDRQKIDANTCYVGGSEAALLAPLEISLSSWSTEDETYFTMSYREDDGLIICSDPYPSEDNWQNIANDTVRKW